MSYNAQGQRSQRQLRMLGMPRRTQSDWVQQLNSSPYLSSEIDTYNQGELVQQLETRVAKILNKSAALFFNKGMTAQFSAIKAVMEDSEKNTLVMHPLSHIAYDEADSYKALLGIDATILGGNTPFTLSELTALKRLPSMVCIELPLRRAGFLLPQWELLSDISQWCKNHSVHLHMDGARLWEAAHYYKKTEADIASLFDSVYVSFYKGLGAIGGAVLTGEDAFIQRCKIWRTRLAGDAYTAFPLVISALDGLDNNYKRLAQYVERAKSVAGILRQIPGLQVPDPFTNGFFVFLTGDKDALNKKAGLLNESMGLKLFNQVTEFPNTDRLMVEMQIGFNHAKISDDEIRAYFSEWLN